MKSGILIDIAGYIIYYPSTYITIKEGYYYGSSLLREMPQQEGDEGRQEHNYEEWQTRNSGYVPKLWHKDVQNRKSITLLTIL